MTRHEAYKQFDVFANNAQATFEALRAADERANRFANIFSFYALKGGTNGGVDKRIVEVVFGARPFDQVTLFRADGSGLPTPLKTLLSESGACLRYERMDSGSVSCTLYPATTPDLKQTEDLVFYELIKNPEKLNSARIIKRHWEVFISYMECTNLDSSANLVDRLRIAKMRFTKPLVIDSKVTTPRLHTALGKILLYSLTVGLSGFLLAIVNYFMSSNDIDRLREDQMKNARAIAFAQGKLEAQVAQIAHLQEELRDRHSVVAGRNSSHNNNSLRQDAASQK